MASLVATGQLNVFARQDFSGCALTFGRRDYYKISLLIGTSHYHYASRIAALFQQLPERQFLIDSPQHGLQLRTPGDFARQLPVRVKHLNRAVRALTGRPTSAHIAERIISEAKALLRPTSWWAP